MSTFPYTFHYLGEHKRPGGEGPLIATQHFRPGPDLGEEVGYEAERLAAIHGRTVEARIYGERVVYAFPEVAAA